MSRFIYDNIVSGKNFIGRKDELTILANLLSAGENVCIYETPKTGRHSLLNQAFYNMRVTALQFSVVNVSLLNIRSLGDFVLRLGSGILKTFCTTPLEFEQAVGSYLHDTHFVFDCREFEGRGTVLSLNWDIDDNDIYRILTLPYTVAADRSTRFFVVLDEFQNIMLTGDGDRVCKLLSGVFRDSDKFLRNLTGYVFMGSSLNAMKEIFEVRKLFYRQVEHLDIKPVDEASAITHFVRSFMSDGKVIERDQISQVYGLFRGNMWYLSQFFSICDGLSKGYMTNAVLEEAVAAILGIHEPRFVSVMNDLTTFQVNMLRAILDGNVRFSGTEVIRKYELSSSANVRRLKEALCRKELVTFGPDDVPVILDPLFEYWLRKFFFEN